MSSFYSNGIFLYKKKGGGGRRSTRMGAAGNTATNGPQNNDNKYRPGSIGVGASSISNRRALNRHATVCNNCYPCYMTIGQYNHNMNISGFYTCPMN